MSEGNGRRERIEVVGVGEAGVIESDLDQSVRNAKFKFFSSGKAGR